MNVRRVRLRLSISPRSHSITDPSLSGEREAIYLLKKETPKKRSKNNLQTSSTRKLRNEDVRSISIYDKIAFGKSKHTYKER